MIKFGLVFRDREDVWFGMYNEEHNIEEFIPITDDQGIYDTLKPSQFAFVDVVEENGAVSLKDVCIFDMLHDEHGETAVTGFLIDCDFPSENSALAFENLYVNGIKESNVTGLN